MNRQNLLTELEEFARLAGYAPSTVCKEAGLGGSFYKRLLAGKRYWPETEERLRNYIASKLPVEGTPDA